MHRPIPSLDSTVERLRLTRPEKERILQPDAPLLRVVEAMLRQREHRILYVVHERRLVGAIGLEDVQLAINARYGVGHRPLFAFGRAPVASRAASAGEIMRPPPGVRMGDPIGAALRAMQQLQLDALPVVDHEERLIGELRASDYLELALDVVMATSRDMQTT